MRRTSGLPVSGSAPTACGTHEDESACFIGVPSVALQFLLSVFPHTHAHIHRRGPLGRVTSPPAMELSYATTMHYRDVVFYVTTDRNRAYFVCGGVFIPWGGRVPCSPGRLPSLVWSFEGQAQTTAWSPTMYEASSDNAACRTCVPLGRTRCFWTACVF